MGARGWQQDPDTGGTEYWDGSRGTGFTRPRRKIFAAPAHDRHKGLRALAVGGCGIFLGLATWVGANQVADRPTGWGWFVILGLLVGIVGTAVGVYFLRGQGPTTDEVEDRLAKERKDRAETDRLAAQLVGRAPSPATETRVAEAKAMADPATLEAFRVLDKLFAAHQITRSGHEAAKERLLGTGVSAQLADLAEQYREGMMSETEFAAARLRLLLDL